ncbi:thiamine phosphate synthase [Staphylococcus xylosus]|nr:thiamine phosphate synthase [Staphylococcus xylosus]
MFIAITPYRHLSQDDIKHYCKIERTIDGLLLRMPLETKPLILLINQLIENGFPKHKIIVHSDIDAITQCNLNAIHFKENDKRIKRTKENYPDLQISMSTHNKLAIQEAEFLGLDFVLFGHIFSTASKPNQVPRTELEIAEALKFDIPVVALGGINHKSIPDLAIGFAGIAGISIFKEQDIEGITKLKEMWMGHDL